MTVAHTYVIDGEFVVSFNGPLPAGFVATGELPAAKSHENEPMRRPTYPMTTKRMDDKGKRTYKGRQFQRHAS